MISSIMTYACPPGNLWQTAIFWKSSTPLIIYQCAHWPAICLWRSYFVLIQLYYKTMQAAGRSHTKSRRHKCSEHWPRRSSTQKIQKSGHMSQRGLMMRHTERVSISCKVALTLISRTEALNHKPNIYLKHSFKKFF